MKKILITILAVLFTWIPHTILAANTYSTDLEVGTDAQYWSRADEAALEVGEDFTIEAWIKPESQPADSYGMGILYKFAEVGNNRSYGLKYTTDGIVVQLSSDGTSANMATHKYATTLTLATWVHIAVVADTSANNVEIFINGTSQGNMSVTGSAASAANKGAALNIGTQNDALYEGEFDGKIDDVRLWNDLRSSAEISANYNIELTGSEADLVGYWKFENDGTDETVNALDLTNNNSCTFDTDPAFGAPAAETPPSWWEAFVI